MIKQRYNEFRTREDGAMTALGLFMSLSIIVIGGLAIDVANAMMARTQLQVAADAAAHAALYKREFETADDSKAFALALAEVNMPSGKYGSVMEADDIVFGVWDAAAQVFTPDSSSTTAVMIDSSRIASRNNSVGTYFLKFVGLGSWDVRTQSVFETYRPWCFREGFLGNERVDIQSNNAYINGFCIHSNDHVEVNSNNDFQTGVIVSMPDKNMLVIPNSGFATNLGLYAALRDSAYQMRIVNRLQDIIADLEADRGDYRPHYIKLGIKPMTARNNVVMSDFKEKAVNTAYCSGNKTLKFANGASLRNVVLVTDCKITFGNNMSLENVVIASWNTDAKSISAPNGLRIGENDDCEPFGGSQVLTMGGIDIAAGLQMFGGQLIAKGDISFAAEANGIQGASIIAAGEIDDTSNSNMGLCGSGMEGNFKAEFFRLAI